MNLSGKKQKTSDDYADYYGSIGYYDLTGHLVIIRVAFFNNVLVLILLILYGTVHSCRTCYDYGYRFFGRKADGTGYAGCGKHGGTIEINMIVDERLVTYINFLDTGNSRILMPSNEKLLRYLCSDYSEGDAELFEAFAGDDKTNTNSGSRNCGRVFFHSDGRIYPVPCEIVTIENYEKRIPIARENFKRAGKKSRLHCLKGMQRKSFRHLRSRLTDLYGCRKRTVYSFYAGCSASAENRRDTCPDNVLQDGISLSPIMR